MVGLSVPDNDMLQVPGRVQPWGHRGGENDAPAFLMTAFPGQLQMDLYPGCSLLCSVILQWREMERRTLASVPFSPEAGVHGHLVTICALQRNPGAKKLISSQDGCTEANLF